MSTVYRKTAKGQAEIETRAHRLLPRLRQALILVDGRRTDAELAPMVADAATTLGRLLDDGFIEAIGTTIDVPLPVVAAAPPQAPPETAAPVRKAPSVDALRRDAVRALNDLLGPAADSLSIKLERARSMAELRPLLVTAAAAIGNLRGNAAAQQFTQRFLADADGT
jgi:hypothetical protein